MPLTIALIFFMLLWHRKSVIETFIVMLALPFALVGAVWLLAPLKFKLSVAVWVGAIAVSGLAVELGLLMMLYLDMAYRQLMESTEDPMQEILQDVIVEGATQRIRPMLMTGPRCFWAWPPSCSVMGPVPMSCSVSPPP